MNHKFAKADISHLMKNNLTIDYDDDINNTQNNNNDQDDFNFLSAYSSNNTS